jgi:hypothetical protein
MLLLLLLLLLAHKFSALSKLRLQHCRQVVKHLQLSLALFYRDCGNPCCLAKCVVTALCDGYKVKADGAPTFELDTAVSQLNTIALDEVAV